MSVSTVGYIRKESFIEKLVMSPWFWILTLSFSLVFPIVKSLTRPPLPELPVYYKVPEFSLMNEFGKPFGSNELKGKVYMATFMFTSCPTTCPVLMRKVQMIQKRVRGLGSKVGILSISVDPEVDTPKVLYKFARKYQSNPRVWSFLTGEQKEIENLLIKGFKVPYDPVKDKKELGIFDIVHTEKIVLVDHLGQVRGYYDAEKDDINKLMIDVGLLVNKFNYNSKGN